MDIRRHKRVRKKFKIFLILDGVERFRPYRAIDPDFANLLARLRDAGVGVHAVTTAFEPPYYWLRNDELPVELGEQDSSPQR